MPLFIFVSGYFSKNIQKSKTTILNNILIPYVLFNIIWYCSNSIFNDKFTFSLIVPGWTLWYLLSLFYWRISLQYLIKIKNIIGISIIIAMFMGSLGIYTLSISRSIAFLPFFLIGYYSDENTIYKIKKIDSRICKLLLVVIFIICMCIVFKLNIDVKFLYNSYSYSDFNLNIVLGILIKLFVYITAIVLGICIINLISINKTVYSYIGKHTLTIYLLHIYMIKILHKIVPTWGKNILFNIIVLFSGVIITIILSSDIVQNLYDSTFGKIKVNIKKTHLN